MAEDRTKRKSNYFQRDPHFLKDLDNETKFECKSLLNKIIVFHTHKGGVGKTTLLASFCDFLNLKCDQKNIVLLDLDPQMNLTSWYTKRLDEDTHRKKLRHFIYKQSKKQIPDRDSIGLDSFLGMYQSYLKETKFEWKLSKAYLNSMGSDSDTIRILRGSTECGELNKIISDAIFNNDKNLFLRLDKFLKKARKDVINGHQPIILIDLNPSFSNFNRFFLHLSDAIVFPMTPDVFCKDSVEDMYYNMKLSGESSTFMNHKPKLLGYIMNRVRPRVTRGVKKTKKRTEEEKSIRESSKENDTTLIVGKIISKITESIQAINKEIVEENKRSIEENRPIDDRFDFPLLGCIEDFLTVASELSINKTTLIRHLCEGSNFIKTDKSVTTHKMIKCFNNVIRAVSSVDLEPVEVIEVSDSDDDLVDYNNHQAEDDNADMMK